MLILPSVGRAAVLTNSLTVSFTSEKSKGASFFSKLRRDFCKASEKFRPIAIASPTLFMCVVKVVSAPGNFSKAKRGIFTTT